MFKKNTTRAILDSRIRAFECLAFGNGSKPTAKESQALTQLRTLREESRNKAKLDYIGVQKDCLDTFRTLFKQIADLAYFADGAGKDTRVLEEVTTSLLKLKSAVAEDLLDIKEENPEEQKPKFSMTACAGDEDFDSFCRLRGAEHFRSLGEWSTCAAAHDMQVVDEQNGTYTAIDSEQAVCGTFLLFEGEGCVFKDAEQFEKAFKEV